jgi:D-glycero-alpha-D-manno-heptose-7-phosphate kinase
MIRAAAPVRLDFAGGWTDVAPFATESRGVVVNAAIELRAQVEVELGGTTRRLDSRELDLSREIASSEELVGPGELELLRAAVRVSGVGPCRIVTRSEAPPGSGLGSSGALDVALVAALETALGRTGSPLEWAEEAWRLEAVEAGLPGGRQDQYAAALGGFNRLEFDRGRVRVDRLELDPDFVAALADRMVVCYTGRSRLSSRTIARVMAGYSQRDPVITGALEGMVEVAERTTAALRAADFAALGRLLSANWELQQRLDQGMCTEEMARLAQAMGRAGALGGKAAGAGAGGTMMFLVPGDRASAVRAAEREGATVLPTVWADQGVRVW